MIEKLFIKTTTKKDQEAVEDVAEELVAPVETINPSRRMTTLVVRAFGAGVTDSDGGKSAAMEDLRNLGYDISAFEHAARKPALKEIIDILNKQKEKSDES